MKIGGIVMLWLGLGVRPLGAPGIRQSAVQEWALAQAETVRTVTGAEVVRSGAKEAQAAGADWRRDGFAVFDGAGEMAGPSVAEAVGDPVFDREKCTCNGVPLRGRVKIVEAFADFKVQVVESFADIDVQVVESFPGRCGQWQFVRSFPDFTIQMVRSFPDIKVRYAKSFPGMK